MSSLRRSPAASVLDDDDLLSEILLRLPPQPSSLPHASLVCKRWRSLVSDPKFTRRFRLRHRHNPPLLGCLVKKYCSLTFVPTMEAPNRIPPRRFSLLFNEDHCKLLNSHHGLALVLDEPRSQVLVWDPVARDQHRIALPAGFDNTTILQGTVLRTAGDIQHFQVVLAAADDKDKHHRRVLICIYSSKTGVWGDLISMPIPSTITMGNLLTMFLTPKPARLVENSLYWLLAGNCVGLLELDLERQNLTMIPLPVDVSVQGKPWDLIPMRAEGGGLGFFFLTDFTAQLWKRTTDGDGVTSWVLGRTIELGKLLSLNSEEERAQPWISGFADGSNVVFLRTLTGGFFMIHLELLQFKKLSGHNPISWYHPFESVYASGI